MSLLNPEKLVQIQACFMDLQPQVKLKLLLSFFHIGRRNLEAWKGQLNAIISVAMEDSEPWVCMLADLMKTLPETGKFLCIYYIHGGRSTVFLKCECPFQVN